MAAEDMDDYFIYDNRLASFNGPQPVAKRRASSAAQSRAPKALTWPHKSIKPTDMAKAGFIFQPLPSNPDNVSCFLCNKALDGWEEDDNPLEEHLRHSPECGWAITAAVEAELGGYPREDPRDALMSGARMATFADRWPNENRKGWSCKTKERTPDCPFFSLISSKPAPKKAGQTKAARRSKASRLSIQSFADLASVGDVTADIDDSVLTTASNATTASKATKKTTKGKKAATTARARKTRAKKDEAVEVPVEDKDELEQPGTEDKDELEQEEAVPPPPSTLTKGRKRASDDVEDSVVNNAEEPAPKKRATKASKARASSATAVLQADVEILDAPEPAKKAAAKKTTRKASGTRKVSARRTTRTMSEDSTVSAAPAEIPNDAEIDKQLQADLDRPLTDDEMIPADPETTKTAASRKKQESMQASNQDELLAQTEMTDFAMLDPAPAQTTDAQVDAELKTLQDEMDVDRKEDTEEIKVPKRGRKPGPRKVSKQTTTTATTTKKAKEPAAPVEQPHRRATLEDEEPDELAETSVSFGSAGAVMRRSAGQTSVGSVGSNGSSKSAGKRGRPAKKSRLSQAAGVEPAVVPAVPEPMPEPVPEPAGKPTVKPTAKPKAKPTAKPAAEPVAGPAPEPEKMDAEPAPAPVEEKKRTSAAKRGRPPKNSKPSDAAREEPAPVEAPAEEKPKPVQAEVQVEPATIQEKPTEVASTPKIARKPVPAPKDSPFAIRTEKPSIVPSGSQILPAPPETPRHRTSPAQSAQQATVSPSPSPQASDAENRPPTTQPNAAGIRPKRIPMASLPIHSTPVRQTSPSRGLSPSKQSVLGGGLQSAEPWRAVDLDLVFEEFYHDRQEGGGGEGEGESTAADRYFAKGGELSDRERDMTVEEWIYHNAGQAEQKLKFECESMVMVFEREGVKARETLEGLIVAE
ncbi:hypothetical protein VMCG_05029 [Cytospora schulzeri]|uniref:BIR-domain-containing protein n=1 Tax=Cytospora schulzeri TaxID=448051 RepID=A0A423WM18_9PEZI|nr:hypothetical protein VMCG_05029 [Valsa malicola]